MSTIEKTFQAGLLAAGKRLDGRKTTEMRKPELIFGDSYGNVQVKLGKTWLLVQVSAAVEKPADNRPFEGIFHITTNISSMAGPQFENGRSSQEELVVSRLVEKAVRRSNALDLESLCIVAGKSCWMIRADVHYLNYDGGLVDATCLGVSAALLHFKRPDTSIQGERVIVHDENERPLVSLSIMHLPISVTWSLFEGEIMVLDATASEQQSRKGDMTIAINSDREICQVTKAGGFNLAVDQMLEAFERAHEIAAKFTKMIYERIKADEKVRNKGNTGFDLGDVHDR